MQHVSLIWDHCRSIYIHMDICTPQTSSTSSVSFRNYSIFNTDLFGRGAKKGLLSWLPNEGTLILNNVHKAPLGVLPLLEREVATSSINASLDEDFFMMDDDDELDDDTIDAAISSASSFGKSSFPRRKILRPRHPRIIMTAETRVPALESYAKVIKVPPLRVRPDDIDDIAKYFMRTLARQRGLGSVSLTVEACMSCHLYTFMVVLVHLYIVNNTIDYRVR